MKVRNENTRAAFIDKTINQSKSGKSKIHIYTKHTLNPFKWQDHLSINYKKKPTTHSAQSAKQTHISFFHFLFHKKLLLRVCWSKCCMSFPKFTAAFSKAIFFPLLCSSATCEHICQGNQASTVFSFSQKTNNAISCNSPH